ncbi:MAG: GNAT family N-acetyltransferase [Planctomycetota bacterium]|jgi:ribosomal protein S18 acetylase RimI-like enzyme
MGTTKKWEISREELLAFYESLNNEFQTFKLTIKNMEKSELIVKALKDHKIVGIAGIRRVKFLPVFFIVVKNGHQGRGFGKNLIDSLHEKAKKCGYTFLFLSVMKTNLRAKNLFYKCGYRKFFMKGRLFYMFKIL